MPFEKKKRGRGGPDQFKQKIDKIVQPLVVGLQYRTCSLSAWKQWGRSWLTFSCQNIKRNSSLRYLQSVIDNHLGTHKPFKANQFFAVKE